jgi:hypothetical protein
MSAKLGPVVLGLHFFVASWAVIHSTGMYRLPLDSGKNFFLFQLLYYAKDFYSCRWDFKVHHVAASVMLVAIYCNVSGVFEQKLTQVLCFMELSTIFLDILVLYPKNTVFQTLFVATFFYSRLYCLAQYLYEEGWEEIEKGNKLILFLFVLFFVQVYWAKKILLKFCFRDAVVKPDLKKEA